MADNNKLELVVEVDVNKANASIKSVNTEGLLDRLRNQVARRCALDHAGCHAVDPGGCARRRLRCRLLHAGQTEWAKEWTIEAANHAAHTDKMGMSMVALAKAHGVAPLLTARKTECGGIVTDLQ